MHFLVVSHNEGFQNAGFIGIKRLIYEKIKENFSMQRSEENYHYLKCI